MKFLLQNQEKFTSSTEVHNINMTNKLKLHKPISNLTLYQKGVYYMRIKIYNGLPDCIARVVENKRSFINTPHLFIKNLGIVNLKKKSYYFNLIF